jgi:eukaryotic-like serine/threonine-protein kinase
VDRNLLPAQQGVERSEPRAQLDAELRAYAERPERLYSPDVRQAARAAVARARAVAQPGPVLSRQIATVDTLVTAAETPQRVALTSDNQTDVTVYRVGRLGTFERKEVDLLPGRYTVVGQRSGFRDVRREITLMPGREAPTVVIRCEEPI